MQTKRPGPVMMLTGIALLVTAAMYAQGNESQPARGEMPAVQPAGAHAGTVSALPLTTTERNCLIHPVKVLEPLSDIQNVVLPDVSQGKATIPKPAASVEHRNDGEGHGSSSQGREDQSPSSENQASQDDNSLIDANTGGSAASEAR